MVDARTWTQAERLRERIRTEFLNESAAETQTRKRDGIPATFLFSLLSAAWGHQKTFDASYSYLGKNYRMRSRRNAMWKLAAAWPKKD